MSLATHLSSPSKSSHHSSSHPPGYACLSQATLGLEMAETTQTGETGKTGITSKLSLSSIFSLQS